MKNLTVLEKKSETIYNFLYIVLTYPRRIVSLILKICCICVVSYPYRISYLGFTGVHQPLIKTIKHRKNKDEMC